MRIRKVILAIIILAAVIWAYRHFTSGGADGQAGMQMPPSEVEVTAVKEQDIIQFTDFSGRLQATDDIELRPRISGQVEKVHFTDGQMVKKGDILFTIDADPFNAQVKRAEGARAQALAQQALAEVEETRAEKLYDAKAISKQEYDQRKANARATAATYKSASGDAELARLNLAYTNVRAPISGKVGRAEVTAGNIVTEGQTVLTTLVATAPIYATFDVDENTYLRATQQPDQKTKVLLGLANSDGYPFEGRIQGFDNQLSPESGTIRARAIFDNADGKLIPGLYANVRIGSNNPVKAILLDQKAVGTDQDKKFVYVVKPDNTADYRVVTLDGIYEGKRIITSGLNSGDVVIVNGIQKVMPGAPVKPIPAKAATPSTPVAAPKEEKKPEAVKTSDEASKAPEKTPAVAPAKTAAKVEAPKPATAPKVEKVQLPMIENAPKKAETKPLAIPAPVKLNDAKPKDMKAAH